MYKLIVKIVAICNQGVSESQAVPRNHPYLAVNGILAFTAFLAIDSSEVVFVGHHRLDTSSRLLCPNEYCTAEIPKLNIEFEGISQGLNPWCWRVIRASNGDWKLPILSKSEAEIAYHGNHFW